MTNTQLIKKHAFHNFKDIPSFEKFLKTKYQTYWHNKFKDYRKSLDCIAVKGILFTMDEYDSEGRTITWGNKKKEKALELKTTDRYKFGYQDSKVEIYEPFGFRNDISYIQ